VNAYRDPVDPFEALGDATRRAIVEGLRDGERTVGDLAADLPVSRPAVSQHLGVLKAAGLVLERPQGTRRYYRLDPIGLVRLQGRLDTMWGLDDAGAVVAAPPVEAPRPAPAPPVAPAAGPAGDDDRAGKGGGKKHKKKHGRK
jgi:DNA-binding transcriptional ArsR family regulator